MTLIDILVFLASCAALAFAGNLLVGSLSRISDFLGWKEFTVSFFVMSAATALPEFFVGVSSALRGVPELSFGNIIGQSIIHFTLAVAICAILVKSFTVESSTVRTTAWFSGIMAILPIALIADGQLSRADGVVLVVSFVIYSAWLFSKRKKFTSEYNPDGKEDKPTLSKFVSLMKDVGVFIVGAIIIILAAQGIVSSTMSFAITLGLPLVVVGALIVGAGTALPEIYFSATSARKNHAGLMLGNLLGSTAVSVSMVLGVVSIIDPIVVPDMSPYIISRVFLIAAVAFFILFMSTGRQITRREGILLLILYIAFISAEILVGIGS